MNREQINPITLTQPQIIDAFHIIATTNHIQLIRKADKYLIQCEQNPEFILTLLEIFRTDDNQQMKSLVLTHIKNVIKRNWDARKKEHSIVVINLGMKEKVKEELLILYKNGWKLHFKIFQEIFSYLASKDFPQNYCLLNKFVGEVLSSLASLDISTILQSEEVIPYLQLVKIAYKAYAERPMQHTQENFNTFIAEPLKLAVYILEKINQPLLKMKQYISQMDKTTVLRLLKCSTKIDKIVLYALRSIVSSMQYNKNFINIIKFQVIKLNNLLSLRVINYTDEVDLAILGLLKSIVKIQTHFPLMFSQFLQEYLQLIISLLFNFQSLNQHLNTFIIKSNQLPIVTFSYFATKQQFKSSLLFTENANKQLNVLSQQNCYRIFHTVYNSNNIMTFLQKILGELLNKYHRINEDDQIMFEDAQSCNNGLDEGGPFQEVLKLIKAIMNKFSKESKVFIDKIVQYLTSASNQNHKMTMNMYELIFQLPKIFDKPVISIDSVFMLMQKCYSMKDFDLLCRLIRIFGQSFQKGTVAKCFGILLGILGEDNIEHRTVYQVAVCIKNLMNKSPLSVQKLEPYLTKIFNLIQIYKDVPSHLWNLLHLLTRILEQFSPSIIIANAHHLIQNVNVLTQMPNNGSLIIAALAELLTNILCLAAPNDTNQYQKKLQLCNTSLNLIQNISKNNNLNDCQQQVKSSQYKLLLETIKNVHISFCPQQLKNRLIKIVNEMKEEILADAPSLFFQIMEEYLLSGIFSIKNQDLLALFNSQFTEPIIDHNLNSGISYFSLYYTYTLLTKNFVPELLIISIKNIQSLMGHVSPMYNRFRSQLMLIINYHIIVYGADKVFQIFNSAYQNQYVEWFWPYICSLEYISNKYAKKIVAIGILSSINALKTVLLQKISQNLPIDHILKFVTYLIKPLNIDNTLQEYSRTMSPFCYSLLNKQKIHQKTSSRKIALHVNADWAQFDFSQVYQQEIGKLLREWDWDVDDLHERFDDKLVAKIVKLLNLNQRVVH